MRVCRTRWCSAKGGTGLEGRRLLLRRLHLLLISGKRLTCNFHDLFVNTLAIRVCKHSRNCRTTQQSLKPVYTFYAPAKPGHFQCVARVLLEKGRKLRCWGHNILRIGNQNEIQSARIEAKPWLKRCAINEPSLILRYGRRN